jgi:hypothetical protein
VSNRISHFLEQLWAGGNVFYTDAGSRYVTFDQNVSLANPVGFVDLGSCTTPSTWEGPGADRVLAWLGDTELARWIVAVLDSTDALCAVTALNVSYGADMGGCVPRGHLTYTDNWFTEPITFFDICLANLAVPVGVPDVSIRNHAILSESDVPSWIIAQAGRR